MSLDVPAATLVRAGGSLLLGIVGLTILALARRDRGNIALGTYLAVDGFRLAGQNIFSGHAAAGWVWVPVSTLLLAVTFLALAAFLWWGPCELAKNRRRLVIAVAVLVAVVAAWTWSWWGVDWTALRLGRSTPTPAPYLPFVMVQNGLYAAAGVLSSAFLVLAPLRFAATTSSQASIRRGLAVLAIFLAPGLYEGRVILHDLPNLAVTLDAALIWVGLLVVVPLWLAATRGFDGRLARHVAHAILALMVAAAIFRALFGKDVNDAAVGIERSVWAFVIAFSVFRLGLLGYTPTVRIARRGTLAMAALAVLFIVAQVAQNFLSAKLGLLTGGIVAGAVLFAANPIQKAIEQRGPRPATGAVRGEESYRKALRMALRDRKLTREEETALHELAHDLGISGPRAHALLAEAETEAGRKGRGR